MQAYPQPRPRQHCMVVFSSELASTLILVTKPLRCPDAIAHPHPRPTLAFKPCAYNASSFPLLNPLPLHHPSQLRSRALCQLSTTPWSCSDALSPISSLAHAFSGRRRKCLRSCIFSFPEHHSSSRQICRHRLSTGAYSPRSVLGRSSLPTHTANCRCPPRCQHTSWLHYLARIRIHTLHSSHVATPNSLEVIHWSIVSLTQSPSFLSDSTYTSSGLLYTLFALQVASTHTSKTMHR